MGVIVEYFVLLSHPVHKLTVGTAIDNPLIHTVHHAAASAFYLHIRGACADLRLVNCTTHCATLALPRSDWPAIAIDETRFIQLVQHLEGRPAEGFVIEVEPVRKLG